MQSTANFSLLPVTELDELVLEYMGRPGLTTGRTYLGGYLKLLGLRIQRRRIRECVARVEPANTALRWGIVVSRRQYSVPWPNSLWHLDGQHSLIRWGLVIHGCINGYSRRIVFLRCSNDNLSQTVLELFLKAIENDGLWPSRIHVDYGVENVLVCDAMVEARGEGRGSFTLPREIRELKDSGGTSSGVCVIFSITCLMQWRIQSGSKCHNIRSRGIFLLKASHWSRNVHWDIVVVKSFGGNFATSSEGSYWDLKFSTMEANMETRLESKSFVTPVHKPFCVPNLVATYNSPLLVNF